MCIRDRFLGSTGNTEGATLHLVFNLVTAVCVFLFPELFLALARVCARYSTPLRLGVFLATIFFALPLASIFIV